MWVAVGLGPGQQIGWGLLVGVGQKRVCWGVSVGGAEVEEEGCEGCDDAGGDTASDRFAFRVGFEG